ncbi:MAG TPA: hypothetical protein VFO07_13545 [Roseiflexaceae bacterium]|nr:hypothetical protein [Roseiflexaceae bacterium]
MRDTRPHLPAWIGGILLALVLIAISTRGGGVNSAALMRRFAPDPNAPTAAPLQLPKIDLSQLPEGVRQTVASLRDRYAGGEAVPALTPVASGLRLRVEVGEVKRSGEQVQIRGTVSNIGDAALELPIDAFVFRDSAGVTYAASGRGTTLQPGQSTTLDLTVPLPQGRGLTLVVTVPPDPPIEQILVVETQS